eukprot:m.127190 g.127190  ORF g.127190 m.127190 type:complete len:307 (-) comp15649_c1_seq4:619-1539(-)
MLTCARRFATLIHGSALARALNTETRCDIMRHSPLFERAPSLAIVRVGDDPASDIYVQSKARTSADVGVTDMHFHLPATATQSQVHETIMQLNANSSVDGIILQLPLPPHLNKRPLIQAIDRAKDVDGLHACNVGNLISACEATFKPCTPSGIMHALRKTLAHDDRQHFLAGLHCVVVGASSIVGKPLAMELVDAGGTVTLAHIHTSNLRSYVESADILVVATGQRLLIPGKWVKVGSTVIDVGCHPTENGLVGEVQDDAYNRAAYITPVPGGVGPLTVAFLLRNTVTAWKQHCHGKEEVNRQLLI